MWSTERGLGSHNQVHSWLGGFVSHTCSSPQIPGTNQTLQMLHRKDQIAEAFTSFSWREKLPSRQSLPQLQYLVRKCLGEEDWDSLHNTHSSKWEDKMPRDLIISKQNILDFLPLLFNEDMDAKTWKKGEWGKDCSTGQEAERIKTPTSHLWIISIGWGSPECHRNSRAPVLCLNTDSAWDLWWKQHLNGSGILLGLSALKEFQPHPTPALGRQKLHTLVWILQLGQLHKSRERVRFCTAASATAPFH